MRLTFGDTHYRNYELIFFLLRQTWRERIRRRWTTSQERETIHLFSPERQKKTPANSLRPDATSSLRDLRRGWNLLSIGHLISSRFNLAQYTSGQSARQSAYSGGTEPQKWPPPIALEWARPQAGCGRAPTCAEVRGQESDSTFPNASNVSEMPARVDVTGLVLPDSGCVCGGGVGLLSGEWSAEEAAVALRWRGRGYLRRIRETWWMTQYFHATGKLLRFKLERVTGTDRRQNRKERNPQGWND